MENSELNIKKTEDGYSVSFNGSHIGTYDEISEAIAKAEKLRRGCKDDERN